MSTLKIAIQKSGRLNEDSIQILKDCGISINNGNDQLKAEASNFPLEVLYLRNSDIPQYLIDGVVDLAIVGDNLLVEKGRQIEVIQKLGFSKCKVSVAVPKTFEYNSIQDLSGLRVATSYPNMGYTPAELLKGEVVLDLGTDSKLYTDLATSVTSS